MWSKRPDGALVRGWIERALELAEPASASRARALLARCWWDRNTPEAAHEATALAERLGDIELLSYAWGARSQVAFIAGDFQEALSWSDRRLDILGDFSDPDHVAQIYEDAIPCYCAMARMAEARRLAVQHEAVVASLSAHHRLHGIAFLLEVEEMCGQWERIRELADRTEEAVEANLATPCLKNARSLLVIALAAACAGDEQTAKRFEYRADEIAGEGYDHALVAPRTRLALLRGDLDVVGGLIELLGRARRMTSTYGVAATAARLDALAALNDRSLVEHETPTLLGESTYLQPFALRALGLVRADATLITYAAERFQAIGLEWHAAQTRDLLARA
jgi:hypothetical protein